MEIAHGHDEACVYRVLSEIGRMITRSSAIEEVYERFAGLVGELLPFDRIVIAVVNPDGESYTDVYVTGVAISGWEAGRSHPLEDSATGRVVAAGTPLRRTGASARELAQRFPPAETGIPHGLASFLSAPLIVRDEPIGALHLRSRKPHAYSEEDERLLAQVAAQIGGAVANSQLIERAERDARERGALADIASAVNQELALERVYEEVARHLEELLPYGRLAITRRIPGEREVEFACVRGVPIPGQAVGDRVAVATDDPRSPMTPDRRAVRAGRASEWFIPQSTNPELLRSGLQSWIEVVLEARGEELGAVSLRSYREDAYHERDVRFLQQVARQIGPALRNAALLEALRSLNNDLERQVALRTGELRAVQESMAEGLIVLDAEGTIRYFNRAAANLTRMPAGDALGQSATKVFARIPVEEDSEDLATLGGAVELPAEIEIVLAQPEPRQVSVSAFPIEAGEDTQMLGLLLRDVTRERESQRRRDAFVSVASHELRTPMTTLLGFSELLLNRDPPKADRGKWLELIHREAARLTEIVDDLLNVSRIQSGRVEIRPEQVSLDELAHRVIDTIRPTTDRHTFEIEVGPEASAVRADPGRLEQVLLNLVSNGVKYSPQGGEVRLTTSARDDGSRVAISVSDQGIGIAPEDRDRLFTTFHRISRPETEGIQGTGLGLFIVKSLVDSMGGELRIDSKLHEGSTFTVILPTTDDGIRRGGGGWPLRDRVG